MATGKNKIAFGVRISVDDSGGTARDLSGDLIEETLKINCKADEVPVTGASNTAKNFFGGHSDRSITCQFNMNDTASTGASTVLNGNMRGTGTITIQIGAGGAAPTTGDLEWEGEYVYIDTGVTVSNGALVHNCVFQPTGATAPAWTTVS